MYRRGKESCNVFPLKRWETEARCNSVFWESDLDLYKVFGAQLGIKIRNCVLCLCSGGEGDEVTGKHFQTVWWSGLVQKKMQIVDIQLPGERRGSMVRQLVEKQVQRKFPDSHAVILLWTLSSSVNLPSWNSLIKVSFPHVPKIVLDEQLDLLVKPFWLLSYKTIFMFSHWASAVCIEGKKKKNLAKRKKSNQGLT